LIVPVEYIIVTRYYQSIGHVKQLFVFSKYILHTKNMALSMSNVPNDSYWLNYVSPSGVVPVPDSSLFPIIGNYIPTTSSITFGITPQKLSTFAIDWDT
jgi:hypothetical protein